MGQQAVQRVLIEVFTKWGKPALIRVDNGRPLGDPTRETIPPLALWLMASGIAVHFNRPRTPTQNAKVERCQRTMAGWTEYDQCRDYQHLQERLTAESHFYNTEFQDRRQQNSTRQERYPTLSHTGRHYDAKDFALSRVLEYLSTCHWRRKVAVMGQISHFGQRFSVGKAYAGQLVSIRMAPDSGEWVVRAEDDQVVKRQPSGITEQGLQNLEIGTPK